MNNCLGVVTFASIVLLAAMAPDLAAGQTPTATHSQLTATHSQLTATATPSYSVSDSESVSLSGTSSPSEEPSMSETTSRSLGTDSISFSDELSMSFSAKTLTPVTFTISDSQYTKTPSWSIHSFTESQSVPTPSGTETETLSVTDETDSPTVSPTVQILPKFVSGFTPITDLPDWAGGRNGNSLPIALNLTTDYGHAWNVGMSCEARAPVLLEMTVNYDLSTKPSSADGLDNAFSCVTVYPNIDCTAKKVIPPGLVIVFNITRPDYYRMNISVVCTITSNTTNPPSTITEYLLKAAQSREAQVDNLAGNTSAPETTPNPESYSNTRNIFGSLALICFDPFFFTVIGSIVLMLITLIVYCCKQSSSKKSEKARVSEFERRVRPMRSLVLHNSYLQFFIPCRTDCVVPHALLTLSHVWCILLVVAGLSVALYVPNVAYAYEWICAFLSAVFVCGIQQPLCNFYFWVDAVDKIHKDEEERPPEEDAADDEDLDEEEKAERKAAAEAERKRKLWKQQQQQLASGGRLRGEEEKTEQHEEELYFGKSNNNKNNNYTTPTSPLNGGGGAGGWTSPAGSPSSPTRKKSAIRMDSIRIEHVDEENLDDVELHETAPSSSAFGAQTRSGSTFCGDEIQPLDTNHASLAKLRSLEGGLWFKNPGGSTTPKAEAIATPRSVSFGTPAMGSFAAPGGAGASASKPKKKKKKRPTNDSFEGRPEGPVITIDFSGPTEEQIEKAVAAQRIHRRNGMILNAVTILLAAGLTYLLIATRIGQDSTTQGGTGCGCCDFFIASLWKAFALDFGFVQPCVMLGIVGYRWMSADEKDAEDEEREDGMENAYECCGVETVNHP